MKLLVKILALMALSACLMTPPAIAGAAPTGPLKLAADAPETYVVVRGDTLWDISGRYLVHPWRWPELWKVNPSIKDPHWIYPGDILHLIWVDGQPQLSLERGNTVTLSPEVRTSPLGNAITAIPYDIIAAFMTKPSVVAIDEADALPYVVALRDRHVIGGTGDQIYARGVTGSEPGRLYDVVRLEKKLTDPVDHSALGYMAVYNGRVRLLGQGTVDREPTELATLAITNSAREIVEGDRLVADEAELKADFIPHSPDQTIDGQIIAVVNGIATVGQYQVVVINRGKAHGLEPGHVLISWQRSDVAVDRKGRGPGAQREFRSLITKHVQLPDERSGSMMIFKTYDKMSYALMMTSNTSARVNDPVRNP